MRSFSTGGIGLNGHIGSAFSEIVDFRKIEIPHKCQKSTENDSKRVQKNDRGSREVMVGQNWAANPLAGSRTSTTSLKIK